MWESKKPMTFHGNIKPMKIIFGYMKRLCVVKNLALIEASASIKKQVNTRLGARQKWCYM